MASNTMRYYLWDSELRYIGFKDLEMDQAAPATSTLEPPPGQASFCWYRMDNRWIDCAPPKKETPSQLELNLGLQLNLKV